MHIKIRQRDAQLRGVCTVIWLEEDALIGSSCLGEDVEFRTRFRSEAQGTVEITWKLTVTWTHI